MIPDPARQRQKLKEAAEAQLGEAVLTVGLLSPAGTYLGNQPAGAAGKGPAFERADRSARALAEATSWKGTNALMAVTADRVILFKVNWTARKIKRQVAAWDRTELRVAITAAGRMTDVSLEVPPTGKRIDLEGDARLNQPLFRELATLAPAVGSKPEKGAPLKSIDEDDLFRVCTWALLMLSVTHVEGVDETPSLTKALMEQKNFSEGLAGRAAAAIFRAYRESNGREDRYFALCAAYMKS